MADDNSECWPHLHRSSRCRLRSIVGRFESFPAFVSKAKGRIPVARWQRSDRPQGDRLGLLEAGIARQSAQFDLDKAVIAGDILDVPGPARLEWWVFHSSSGRLKLLSLWLVKSRSTTTRRGVFRCSFLFQKETPEQHVVFALSAAVVATTSKLRTDVHTTPFSVFISATCCRTSYLSSFRARDAQWTKLWSSSSLPTRSGPTVGRRPRAAGHVFSGGEGRREDSLRVTGAQRLAGGPC